MFARVIPRLPREMLEHALAAYDAAGRHYHTWIHVNEVVERYQEVRLFADWQHPLEVLVAVYYHDAVYDPRQKDNEAASSELAEEACKRWLPQTDTDRVHELILLTARHSNLSLSDVDPEEALFLDCDMAILGASSTRFKEYCDQIAAEYAPFISPESYAAGRRAFLQKLLDAPCIFLSDYFHARLDKRARKNLRAALRTT